MIEMSVEKETILPGDGGGDTLTLPQPLSENPGGGGNKPLRHATVIPAFKGGSVLASTVLSELPANHSTTVDNSGQLETEGLAALMGSKALQSKNSLHSQAGLQQPPQQTQKLSKRRYSMNTGFKHPGFSKRRRRANSESDPVLPTNFLLGGNIFDPLNLNSLMDEDINRALNAETPKSSPLPAKNRDPVEILIPKDITDPLNLNGRGGGTHEGVLVSPLKSGGRRRHRNRHHGGLAAGQADSLDLERSKGAGEDGAPAVALLPVPGPAGTLQDVGPEVPKDGSVLLGLRAVEESPRPYELNTTINCRDEVVPPILPRRRSHPSNSSSVQPGNGDSSCQPSRHRKRRRTSSRSDRLSITPTPSLRRAGTERAGQQTFHTPIGGGVTGAPRPGAHQSAQPRRKPQRRFQYGNYSQYYGYRTPNLSQDPRLTVFKPEWFHGKNVLDLGCNTGHLTLAIAKNWSPTHILGLDLDGGLVHAARQNLRHFLSEMQRQAGQVRVRYGPGRHGWTGRGETGNSAQKRRRKEEAAEKMETSREKRDKMEDCAKQNVTQNSVATDKEVKGDTSLAQSGRDGSEEGKAAVGVRGLTPLMSLPSHQWHTARPFPISFRTCRGPIVAPPILEPSPRVFPSNITFMKGNYVLESDGSLASQRPEYDVILCLSLTKWVHLNWGDGGLQRLFKRAFRQLRPGGLFILEPQPWSSYSKRKRLTETIYRNYNSIRLKPEQFSSYLTAEVGFTCYELLGTPKQCSRGFQRPMYLFHKGPSSSRK